MSAYREPPQAECPHNGWSHDLVARVHTCMKCGFVERYGDCRICGFNCLKLPADLCNNCVKAKLEAFAEVAAEARLHARALNPAYCGTPPVINAYEHMAAWAETRAAEAGER